MPARGPVGGVVQVFGYVGLGLADLDGLGELAAGDSEG